MKIHPVGANLFHVDRWTDMTKLLVAFRNLANVQKKEWQNKQEERLNHMLKQKGTKGVVESHYTSSEGEKEMRGGMWKLV